MKDIIHTRCVDSNSFLFLLYLAQRDEKLKTIARWFHKDFVVNIYFRVFIEQYRIYLCNFIRQAITDNLVTRCVFCKQSQFPSLFNNFHFKFESRCFHSRDSEEYFFSGMLRCEICCKFTDVPA